MKKYWMLLLAAGLAFPALAVDPPANLKVCDAPNDDGRSVTITWNKSAAETADPVSFKGYRVLRAESASGPYAEAGFAFPGSVEFADNAVAPGVQYYYKLNAVTFSDSAQTEPAGPVISSAQWFNVARVNILIAFLAFTGLILLYIYKARHGADLFVRRIAGLQAVDEAIGRATEMGRPILYLPSGGLSAVSDIQTLASLVILGRVANKAAEYDTPLLVPCSDPLVMTLAQEIVKSGYMNAGRPDAYRAENIRYLTNEQFAYTAGVDGMMVREKPAANFMIGTFYAESLILAETGYSTGAIQIAGTAMITQLPFFVAACDYTLIGEEIYAASAYLSKEPVLLGTIKAQDWGKAAVIFLILAGVLLQTLALKFPSLGFFSRWLMPR
ncbi:hypothetical protein HY768_09945 [candidate division TA06 bacterium]|uniref:DUF6754 domain-containing protein n=1 Tax=candidate division TA06 bacterium TaxID=2250710 RepID=A0A933IB21_UNCT6|nr:hypothetical protein [candidate division TA06 bacterium]